MIPYAILMMELDTKHDKGMQIRILNPLQEGVSFRVEKNQSKSIEEGIEKATFYFLNFKTKRYEKIIVTDGIVEAVGYDNECDDMAIIYSFYTKSQSFQDRLQRLITDYMQYIEIKTNCDEFEAMERLTGVSLEEDYATDIYEWKRSVCEDKYDYSEPLKAVEIAISLDKPTLWNKFLELDWTEFKAYYWRENCLDKHPLSRTAITHVYIGNQTCGFLFPDEDIFRKILAKVEKLKLYPVVVFSPMNELLVEKNEKILNELTDGTEIVINDLGLAALISSLNKKYIITAGIFLNKRKKDIRADSHISGRKSSLNDEVYIEYLKNKMRISSFSFEATGYEQELIERDSILHLPLYQMNTAGYCTLSALCKYADRGKQEYQKECPHYCEKKYVLYPKNINAVGIGNTIYGFSKREINDVNIINEMIEKGIKRLVIRL